MILYGRVWCAFVMVWNGFVWRDIIGLVGRGVICIEDLT